MITGLAWVWAEFILCAALIGIAGPVLVRNGDIIGRLTGVSQSWIGLILLATATSLPELFTGLSSVTMAAQPNIAVGDALGSCVFNLLLLVLLDELCRGEPLYRRIDQGQILTAAFGIILIGSTGAVILLSKDSLNISFLHMSVYTPFIIVLYFVAMRAAFVYESRQALGAISVRTTGGISLKVAAIRYAVAAAVVVVAGSWLPFIGSDLSEIMGWRTTFVGTIFIAGATSLPELVVSVSAVRMGAVDMAISTLLGSNLFNVLILALDDMAYTEGSLFAAVSSAHVVSVIAAVIMSGIFIVAVLYRPKTRLHGTIGWVSLSLLLVYLLSAYAAYETGHSG